MLDLDMAETRGPPKYLHPKGWEDHDIRYSCGLSRGRGGRGRGRGRSCGSRSRRPELGRVLAGNIQKQTQGQRHRGSSRGRACPRGRRTVRKRQSRFGRKAVEKVVVPGCLEKAGDTSEIDGQESPQSYAGGEEGEAGRMYAEGDDNNSHGLYDCNENVQLFGNDEYEDDYQGTEDYSVSYKRKREDLMHESEDDGNGDEDDDGEGYERSYYAGDEDADGDRGRNQERFDDMDEGIEVNEFDDEGNSDEDDDTMSSPESSDN